MKNELLTLIVLATALLIGFISARSNWERNAYRIQLQLTEVLSPDNPDDLNTTLQKYDVLISQTRSLANKCPYVLQCTLQHRRNAYDVINLFEQRGRDLHELFEITKQGRQAEKDGDKEKVAELLPKYFSLRHELGLLTDGLHEEISARPSGDLFEAIFKAAL